MPDELAEARIDRKAFHAAQLIVGKYHRIGFPLRFWQGTNHEVDFATARRLVEGVCKCDLPDVRPHLTLLLFAHVHLHVCPCAMLPQRP